jgi:hypothetical protein
MTITAVCRLILGTSLAAEHAPQGPTEEHLVEELAGILWRKRRLRLARGRHGLDDALSQSRHTAKRAVVHIDAADGSEDVAETVRATAADIERRRPRHGGGRSHDPPSSRPAQLAPQRPLRGGGSGAARGHANNGGPTRWPAIPTSWKRARNRSPPTSRDYVAFWTRRSCRGSRRARRNWPTGRWRAVPSVTAATSPSRLIVIKCLVVGEPRRLTMALPSTTLADLFE